MCGALILAGCSEDSLPDASGRADTGRSRSVDPGDEWAFDAALTYDLYFSNPAFDEEGVVRAYSIAFARFTEEEIARCMADRGFDHRPTNDALLETQASRQFDVRTRAVVTVEGYGISTQDESADAQPDDPLPPEHVDALAGEDGCETEGRRLQLAFDTIANDYSPILVKLWEQHESSDVVTGANRRWVECMHRAGHDFSHPTDAEDTLAAEYALLPDTDRSRREFAARERAVALDDFDCSAVDRATIEASLTARWQRFDQRYRSRIARDLASAYAAYEE